jgi:hypothetical protein
MFFINSKFLNFLSWFCHILLCLPLFPVLSKVYEYKRAAYRNLVGKPEGKRPLGRRRRRWEDSIATSG